MSVNSDSRTLLFQIQNLCKEQNKTTIPYNDLKKITKGDPEQFNTLIEYLLNKDFIKCPAIGYIKITPNGYDWLEDIPTISPHTIIYQVDTNYGAIGTNTNFTINNSLDQLEQLIKENTSPSSQDRKTALSIKSELSMLMQSDLPMSKGCLSKFSDFMEKHSWITGSIANIILQMCIHS